MYLHYLLTHPCSKSVKCFPTQSRGALSAKRFQGIISIIICCKPPVEGSGELLLLLGLTHQGIFVSLIGG